MAQFNLWIATIAFAALFVHVGAVKVMPLGDSITLLTCWRALLWQNLDKNGLAKDLHFVGTQRSMGNCRGIKYDSGHEGYPAIKATDWAPRKLPPILTKLQPDIVMMHLGTNDVAFRKTPQAILEAFTTLVGQMRTTKPNMQIIVAKIIPMQRGNVASLNEQIDKWASSKSTSVSPITVVDCTPGFNSSRGGDTSDGVHPNDSGDKKVAACFYPALAKAIKSSK